MALADDLEQARGSVGGKIASLRLDDMVRATAGRPFPHFSQPKEVSKKQL